jgi:hypothetical protein
MRVCSMLDVEIPRWPMPSFTQPVRATKPSWTCRTSASSSKRPGVPQRLCHANAAQAMYGNFQSCFLPLRLMWSLTRAALIRSYAAANAAERMPLKCYRALTPCSSPVECCWCAAFCTRLFKRVRAILCILIHCRVFGVLAWEGYQMLSHGSPDTRLAYLQRRSLTWPLTHSTIGNQEPYEGAVC